MILLTFDSPYIWNAGNLKTILFPDSQGALPQSVNKWGQIAGIARDAAGVKHAFSLIDGVATFLPDPNKGLSAAYSINDSNQVAGYLTKPVDGSIRPTAVVWSTGKINYLDSASYVSEAVSINSKGDVAGISTDSPAVPYQAAAWIGGTKFLIGTFGGETSDPHSINDNNIVVGESFTALGNRNAFSWSIGGKLQDLGTLPGDNSSIAYSINNSGTIVGTSGVTGTSIGTAVIWKDSKIEDLNKDLPIGSGWKLGDAEAINSKGQILGYGEHNGVSQVYLLTPQQAPPAVPLPASVWMGLFTLPGVWYARRQMLRRQGN